MLGATIRRRLPTELLHGQDGSIDIRWMRVPLPMRILALVILLLPILGCARTVVPYLHGPLPPPPSEALRAELGDVWIDSILAQPEVQFVITPAIGKWSGFGRGAGAGAITGCVILGLPAAMPTPPTIALGVVGCAAGATVGAIPGGIYGAIAAEPKEAAQAAMAVIRNSMASDVPQWKVRDRARELARLRTAVPLASQGNAAATRLEVAVLSIQLDGLPLRDSSEPFDSFGVINPPLRLVVTAQARLIRFRDQAELYAAQFEYWGPKMTVPEWADSEAEPLRDEIDRATAALAEQIVDAVFLLYRAP